MIQVYLPTGQDNSFKKIVQQMLKGAKNDRYAGYGIFWKDVKADYARSKFGLLWDFLEPLVYALVFVFLRNTSSFSVGEMTIPYAVYVTCGILTWQSFSDSLLGPLEASERSKGMLTHLKLSPEAIIYSSVFKTYFYSAIRISIIVFICMMMGAFSFVGLLKFIAVFPILTILGYGIGLLLAPFNAVYNDVIKIIRICIRPLMFVSAIIFPLPDSTIGNILSYSPIAILVDGLRSLIVSGSSNEALLISIIFASVIPLFFAGWYIYHKTLKFMAEKMQ